jgi:hypothetical protein
MMPITNGLSDHDGQLLTTHLPYKVKNFQQIHFVRKINKDTLTDFQFKLSFETWEPVFGGKDVNEIFNTFVNTFLRIYYSSCPLIQVNHTTRLNTWITSRIKRSCQRKKELYLKLRTNENVSLKMYYKKYCHILSNVIRMAKILEYERKILTSKNKVRTTWKIMNNETDRYNYRINEIQSINVDGINTENQQTIANTLSKHFIFMAEKINHNIYIYIHTHTHT